MIIDDLAQELLQQQLLECGLKVIVHAERYLLIYNISSIEHYLGYLWVENGVCKFGNREVIVKLEVEDPELVEKAVGFFNGAIR